jgi:hypothetical protein
VILCGVNIRLKQVAIHFHSLLDESRKVRGVELLAQGKGFFYDWNVFYNLAWFDSATASNDQLRSAVIDSVCQLFGGKATENNRVSSSESSASKHSEGSFDNHWHIDYNTVANTDFKLVFKHGGKFSRLHHNLVVCPRPLHTCVHAIFKEGDTVPLTRDDMTVEAVVGDVGQTTLEPPVEILIARVNRSGPFFVPINVLSLSLKKGALILDRVAIKSVVDWCHKIVRTNLIRVSDVFIINKVNFRIRISFPLVLVAARSHLFFSLFLSLL